MEILNGYLCNCFVGLYGINCNKVNNCFYNLCGEYGKCSFIESGFMCNCDEGWVGDNCLYINFCFSF